MYSRSLFQYQTSAIRTNAKSNLKKELSSHVAYVYATIITLRICMDSGPLYIKFCLKDFCGLSSEMN